MENILSLQDLKRAGLAKIKQMFNNEPDIIIQDRGKDACVLVNLEHYSYLRSCELEIELLKAKADISQGKFTMGTENHIQRMEKLNLDGELAEE